MNECFGLMLPLETTVSQRATLVKRFDIEKKIYNIVLKDIKSRIFEMQKTRRYRTAISIRDEDGNLTPEAKQTLLELRKEYRISKFEFEKDIQPHRRFYSKNIDAHTGAKLANRLWESVEKLLFSDGEELHFKKRNSMKTIQCKTNKSGIRFDKKMSVVKWNGLTMPVSIRTDYEKEAIDTCDIAYCMIKRIPYDDGYQYYLVLTLKGIRPIKYDENTGEIKRQIGDGRVGLDIGMSTVAVVTKDSAELHEIAPSAQEYAKEIKKIQRAMDRSSRATNPDNYNENGTVKKGRNRWKQSKRYKKLCLKLRALYAKDTRIREYEHHLIKLAILSKGNEVYVETMNFKNLQERKEEEQANGEIYKKKNHGKAIANRAPAKLLSYIKEIFIHFDGYYIEINTYKARASQFNHETEDYIKKELSERWNIIQGEKVQRDLYSAFLIMHINNALETFKRLGII